MAYLSQENNFLYLTIGIVLLLFVGAMSEQLEAPAAHQLIQAFSAINIIVGLYGFRAKNMWFHSKFGLVLMIIGIIVIGLLVEFFNMYSWHLFLLLCFYLWALWLAGRQILFSGAIDRNSIIGAICIYLLMGLIWALLYLLVAQFLPGAFIGIAHDVWHVNFSNAIYFSFVTLTTLGYGDISPVAPVARFLVYMEAIVGVFYMAILVASLIGARVSKYHEHH
jgi:voltage-gated potassium channel